MMHDASAAIVKTLERLVSEWSGLKLVGNHHQLGLGRLARRLGADRERQQQQDAGSSIFSLHEGKSNVYPIVGDSKHK
jgi:hypothetical protein